MTLGVAATGEISVRRIEQYARGLCGVFVLEAYQ